MCCFLGTPRSDGRKYEKVVAALIRSGAQLTIDQAGRDDERSATAAGDPLQFAKNLMDSVRRASPSFRRWDVRLSNELAYETSGKKFLPQRVFLR